MTNNARLLAITIAILLIFLVRDQIKAGFQHLSPKTQEPIRQEWGLATGPKPALDRDPASDREPTPLYQEIRQPERPRYEKCLDGSALTVTSRDNNQTNFRCASGAIGAYTN